MTRDTKGRFASKKESVSVPETKAEKDARLAWKCLTEKWYPLALGENPETEWCAFCEEYHIGSYACGTKCPMQDGTYIDGCYCCRELTEWKSGGRTPALAIPVVRKLERIAGVALKDSRIQPKPDAVKPNPAPKPAPKFKVGQRVRHSCDEYGVIESMKYNADIPRWEYLVKWQSLGTAIAWEVSLTPDTRPRIRVTAIDREGKLHKWSFLGTPDWKRIEREVLEVGVAAVVEAPKDTNFCNGVTFGEDVMTLAIPSLGIGVWSLDKGLFGTWDFRSAKRAIAALRERIREHYAPKPAPEYDPASVAFKHPLPTIIDRCPDCAHEFTPKGQPEHVAGERCDAPTVFSMLGIDHFEFTGEKRDTVKGEWYYVERDAMVSKADWFNEKNVWILRPVPKPKPTFKPGDWVVNNDFPEQGPFQYRDGMAIGYKGYHMHNPLRPARQSDFEVTRGGHKFLLWDRDRDWAPYLYVDGKRDGEHREVMGSGSVIRALCDALGLAVMPADIEEG